MATNECCFCGRNADQVTHLIQGLIFLFVTFASMPVSTRSPLRTMAGESAKLTTFCDFVIGIQSRREVREQRAA